jgi:hypothetical protein
MFKNLVEHMTEHYKTDKKEYNPSIKMEMPKWLTA